MAGAGDVKAGGAYVELRAKDDQLSKILAAVEAKVKALGDSIAAVGKKMAAVGGAITAPLLAAATQFKTLGVDLLRMSARTGVSVESLSQLGYVAQKAGGDIEDIEAAVTTLNTALTRLSLDPQGLTVFTRLGLSARELMKAGPEESFLQVAEALAKIENPAVRASLAVEALGGAGYKLLPVLAQGPAALGKFRDEFRAMHGTVGTEAALAAKEFSSAWGKVTTSLKIATYQLGGAVVPVLTAASLALAVGAQALVEFIRENQALVAVVGVAAGALVGLGVSLIAMGTALRLMAPLFPVLAAGIHAAKFAVLTFVAALRVAWAATVAASLAYYTLAKWFVLTSVTAQAAALALKVKTAAMTALAVVYKLAAAGLLAVWVGMKGLAAAGLVASASLSVETAFMAASTAVAWAKVAAIYALKVAIALLGAVILAAPLVLFAAGLAGAASGVGGLDRALGILSDSLGRLKDDFADIKQEAVSAWGGISTALKAGDIGAAARVGWAFIRVEWQRGVNFLRGVWFEFADFATDTWQVFVVAVLETAGNMWMRLQQLWSMVIRRLVDDIAAVAELLPVQLQAPLLVVQAKLAGLAADEAAMEERRKKETKERLEELKQARDARAAATLLDRAAGQQRLEQLRKELAAAVDEARRLAPANSGPGGRKGPDTATLPGRVDVAGTFAAAAIRGLSTAGSPELKELQQIREHLAELRRRAGQGGLVFV